jgi:hypothetical protein
MPGTSNNLSTLPTSMDQKQVSSLIPLLLKDEKNTLPTEKLAVYSIDYDGCLASTCYNQSVQPSPEKKLIEANSHLFHTIAQEIRREKFSDVIVMTGSNRQSQELDQFNAYEHGNNSSFPQLKYVTSAISRLSGFNCTLDTTLLADFFNDKPAGSSYQIATNGQNQRNQDKTCFDESKITLLYAQVHKIAAEYPNHKIIFNFFDDRANNYFGDILPGLKIYFTQHPELLPANVALQLYFYDGKTLSTAFSLPAGYVRQEYKLCDPKPIQGTGPIDFNFKNTLKDIAQQFGDDKQRSVGDLYNHRTQLTEFLNASRNPNKKETTINKEQGKVKDLAMLTHSFDLNSTVFPRLIDTVTVLENDKILKKRIILEDKYYAISHSIVDFVFNEKQKIKLKIPTQQAKHDKKFFGFFYSSKNVKNSELQLTALDKFSDAIISHNANFDNMSKNELDIINNFKAELTPILKPYAEDFDWISRFILPTAEKVNMAKPK